MTRSPETRVSRAALVGVVLVLTAIGAAVLYKASGAIKAIAKAQTTGTLGPKARWLPVEALSPSLRPFVDTVNYFSWIVIALLFGVLIGALVKAALPARWLSRVVGGSGPLGIVWGALIGAPLMLCSCCIAPVFDGAYARTRKLGPSLALMLAAPGLNPADLAITALVFPWRIALARGVLSLLAVLGISTALGGSKAKASTIDPCPIDEPNPTWASFGNSLWRSLLDTARRSLPAMVVGAFVSMLLTQLVPVSGLAHFGGAQLVIVVVAAVATLLALPTFGEIPLGLGLMLAGAPTGAVVAVLVAGPIINLPSLFILRRTVSARVAVLTGGAVFLLSYVGGAIAGGLI